MDDDTLQQDLLRNRSDTTCGFFGKKKERKDLRPTSSFDDNRRMIRLVSFPRRHLLRVFIVGNVKATTKKAEVSVSRGICYVSYKTLANTTMNCTNGFLQNFGTYHNELYRWFSRCNTSDHNETETKSPPIEHIDTFSFL